jgi:hypothetical protein
MFSIRASSSRIVLFSGIIVACSVISSDSGDGVGHGSLQQKEVHDVAVVVQVAGTHL